jgi:hypothetical protein
MTEHQRQCQQALMSKPRSKPLRCHRCGRFMRKVQVGPEQYVWECRCRYKVSKKGGRPRKKHR